VTHKGRGRTMLCRGHVGISVDSAGNADGGHRLRHHHHCEPVQAARSRRNFSCFQRGLPGGCELLRLACIEISVSEWPLVSGRANRVDSGSVKNFSAISNGLTRNHAKTARPVFIAAARNRYRTCRRRSRWGAWPSRAKQWRCLNGSPPESHSERTAGGRGRPCSPARPALTFV